MKTELTIKMYNNNGEINNTGASSLCCQWVERYTRGTHSLAMRGQGADTDNSIALFI